MSLRFLPAALLALTLSACGSPVEYGEDLLEATGGQKIIDMDDGRQVALSSTGHVLYAQWGEDGSWTEPDQVYADEELTITLGEVQALDADDTVAFSVDLGSEQAGLDEDGGVHSVLVVCHDGSCEDGRASDHLESAEMDRSGRVIAYALSDRELLVWKEGTGFTTTALGGLPAQARTLVLADGSLVAVGWQEKPCRYELFTSVDDAWVKAATTREVSGLCGLAGVEEDGDRIEVYVESESLEIAFVRDGDGWKADVEERTETAGPVPESLGLDDDGRLTIGGRPLELTIDDPREGAVPTADGEHVLKVSCSEGAWRPTYSIASVEAATWPAARPVPGVPDELAARTGAGCTVALGRHGDGYSLTVGSPQSSWSGQYELPDDELVWLDPES